MQFEIGFSRRRDRFDKTTLIKVERMNALSYCPAITTALAPTYTLIRH
jgi:hypothetical protein